MKDNRLTELIKAALMSPISEKNFPDLNDDGKITKADVLIGRGVKLKEDNLSEIDKADSTPEKTLQDVELIKRYLPKINTKTEWLDLANTLLSLENIPGMNNMMKKTFLLKFIKEKLGSK